MTIKQMLGIGNVRGLGEGEARSVFHYATALFIILFISSVSFIGCTKSPETARKDLSTLNVAYTPEQFMNSAKAGNTKVVELFLQAGMDVNVKNGDGQTALMLAAYSGHTDTVKLLLKHGAFINVVDKFGDSALSWAAAENHTDIVTLLKKAEIDKSY
jgi:ankyrin repeat protein